ncbi:interferon-induced protein with tetratricopeptide repeats 5-like [Colossoma macropomum]|uniref:interferon-induced protein with tetratricopeptide repeats 5-like n=1 Tax=Colossoma macropomum TaxID=42526 RepID=UPI0018649029|nr:interferon-induced protein with tetratricopeptide repeats 5-like [Colossoma macropomum]
MKINAKMSLMDAFKTRLPHLECHFTWALREEEFNLYDLGNRLEEQIKLESGEARVTRAYSSLAFVCYLHGNLHAALTHLHKSEELAKEYYAEDSEKFLTVTYGNFAWLYYHMGNFTLAENYLSQVERINMKFSNKSSNEVHREVLREKAWAFHKFSRKYYNGARECFRQALEIAPEDSDLNAGYAIVLYQTTKDASGSQDSQTVVQLRRAIDLNPKDAVLLLFLTLKLICTNKSSTSHKSEIHDPSKQSKAVILMMRALEMSPENPHVM